MAKFAVDDCRRVNGSLVCLLLQQPHFDSGAVFNQPERAHRSCDEIKSATGAGVDTAVLRFDKKRYVRKTAMDFFVCFCKAMYSVPDTEVGFSGQGFLVMG